MTAASRPPLLDGVRCCVGREVRVTALTGGLSTTPFRVTAVDAGPPLDVVVRPPSHGLVVRDRAAEHRASVAAADAGVGPAVVEFVPPRGPLVVAHLDARPLTPAEVRADLGRVAALCRRLHAGPRSGVAADPVGVLRRYADRVAALGSWLPRGHAALAPAVRQALAALALDPVPAVPCHNDLPGGNILDDGRRWWLVDFEFAADHEPWGELGTLASGAALSPGEVEELVTTYDDRAGPVEVARTRVWDAVGSWTFVLWASLRDADDEPDSDYRAVGEQLLDRARGGLDGPTLDRLLCVLAGNR